MKRIAALLLMIISLFASQTMVVYKSDGSVVEMETVEIDSICFKQSNQFNISLAADENEVVVNNPISLNVTVSGNDDVSIYWKDGGDVTDLEAGWIMGSKTKTFSKNSAGIFTFHVLVMSLTEKKTASVSVSVVNENPLREYPIHYSINASTFWFGHGTADANHDISQVPTAWMSDVGFGVEDWPGLERDADFIPTDSRFTGDQYPETNPYYFALPYNDITDLVYDGQYVNYIVDLKPDYEKKFIDYMSRDAVVTTAYGNFFDSQHRKKSSELIPWKDDLPSWTGKSMVKGRWARIRYNGGNWVYAQWLDAGPFHYDDADYVFGDGSTKPRNQHMTYGEEPRAGIDLSPSVMLKLGVVDPNSMEQWQKNNWMEFGSTVIDGAIEWQFVDFEDVPDGPWKRIISDNNTYWE